MTLKNLFFKLNIENAHHKEIIDFFNDETIKLGIPKIDLLYRVILLYKYVGKLDSKLKDTIKITENGEEKKL